MIMLFLLTIHSLGAGTKKFVTAEVVCDTWGNMSGGGTEDWGFFVPGFITST